MYCLYEQWHALAAWAAGQPVYLQITVGSAILTLAYVLFVLVLSSLAGTPKLIPGSSSGSSRT
jgi:hypothetical protein